MIQTEERRRITAADAAICIVVVLVILGLGAAIAARTDNASAHQRAAAAPRPAQWVRIDPGQGVPRRGLDFLGAETVIEQHRSDGVLVRYRCVFSAAADLGDYVGIRVALLDSSGFAVHDAEHLLIPQRAGPITIDKSVLLPPGTAEDNALAIAVFSTSAR